MSPVGAKHKIIRRADGSQCRVRPTSATTEAVAVETAAATEAASTADSYSVEAAAYTEAASTDAAYTEAVYSSEAAYASPTESSSAEAQQTEAASSSVYTEAASTEAASAVTTASSSSSTAGAASSGGTTNVGSKFGAAWPNGDYASSSDPNYIGNYIGSKTSWYYTWAASSVSAGDNLGLEFVPMLWGPSSDLVSAWWAAQSSWPSSVKHALFFNEPNESSQSNVAVNDAISYWMNDYLPVRASKGLLLGSAATTSAPSGLTWVTDFPTACTGAGNSAADCAADFVPVHWYDVSATDFQTYLTNFHTGTGLPLWVTEYACQNFNGGAQCSDSETWSLHQTMAAWMDEQDFIQRYSPFGMMENMQGVEQYNALMDTSGSITDLGTYYIYSS